MVHRSRPVRRARQTPGGEVVAEAVRRGFIADRAGFRAWAAAEVPGCESILMKTLKLSTRRRAPLVEAGLRRYTAEPIGYAGG